MKQWNIYKGLVDPWSDEFSHKYSCWANNHNGWAKQKKANKRIAKKRLRRNWQDEMDHYYSDCDLRQRDIFCLGCYRYETCSEVFITKL